MTDERWESLGCGFPPRSELVDKRPGSSVMLWDMASVESVIWESVDPWPLLRGFAGCSIDFRDISSMDCFRDDGRKLSLGLCFTG